MDTLVKIVLVYRFSCGIVPYRKEEIHMEKLYMVIVADKRHIGRPMTTVFEHKCFQHESTATAIADALNKEDGSTDKTKYYSVTSVEVPSHMIVMQS